MAAGLSWITLMGVIGTGGRDRRRYSLTLGTYSDTLHYLIPTELWIQGYTAYTVNDMAISDW